MNYLIKFNKNNSLLSPYRGNKTNIISVLHSYYSFLKEMNNIKEINDQDEACETVKNNNNISEAEATKYGKKYFA